MEKLKPTQKEREWCESLSLTMAKYGGAFKKENRGVTKQ